MDDGFIDFASGVELNPNFPLAFEKGKEYCTIIANKTIEDKAKYGLGYIKDHLPSNRTLTYIGKEAKYKPCQVKNYDSQAMRALMDQNVITAQENNQFSDGGTKRNAPVMSQLKVTLRDNFEFYEGEKLNLPKDEYDMLFVDGDHLLRRDWGGEKDDLIQHTTEFCNKFIKPLLETSSTIVIAFDHYPDITPLAGQAKLEETINKQGTQIPLTTRLLEHKYSVPILALRQQDELALVDYAKKIIRVICENPRRHLSVETKDYIIVFSGIARSETNHQQLPVSIAYNSSSQQFVCSTCPGIMHSTGPAMDSIFTLAEILTSGTQNSNKKYGFCSHGNETLLRCLSASERLSGRIDYIYYTVSGRGSRFEVYSIDRLKDGILKRFATPHAVKTFITILLDMGYSLYTEKWFGVTLFSILKLLDKVPTFDVVGPAGEVLPDQLCQELDLSEKDIIPSLPLIKRLHFIRITANSKDKQLLARCKEYDDLTSVDSQKKNVRSSHPTTQGLECHYLRVLAAYIYQNTFSIPIESITSLGYKKLNPSLPISISNCAANYNTEDTKSTKRYLETIASRASKVPLPDSHSKENPNPASKTSTYIY